MSNLKNSHVALSNLGVNGHIGDYKTYAVIKSQVGYKHYGPYVYIPQMTVPNNHISSLSYEHAWFFYTVSPCVCNIENGKRNTYSLHVIWVRCSPYISCNNVGFFSDFIDYIYDILIAMTRHPHSLRSTQYC